MAGLMLPQRRRRLGGQDLLCSIILWGSRPSCARWDFGTRTSVSLRTRDGHRAEMLRRPRAHRIGPRAGHDSSRRQLHVREVRSIVRSRRRTGQGQLRRELAY